jgi:hypothetical protein
MDQRAQLKESLLKAKKYYPDAYIKETDIYNGCMH